MAYTSNILQIKIRFPLLVIDHFNIAILLNPKLTNDDVMHTTGGVCPSISLIISAEVKRKKN